MDNEEVVRHREGYHCWWIVQENVVVQRRMIQNERLHIRMTVQGTDAISEKSQVI